MSQDAIHSALIAMAMRAVLENKAEPIIASKPTKEKKTRQFIPTSKKQEPLRMPKSFPEAEPLTVLQFLTKVNARIELGHRLTREPSIMEKQQYCFGFIAWLKETNNPAYRSLSPELAPGALLDNCRRIASVIANPNLTEAESFAHRNGTIVQFGSAGTNHKAEKIIGAMRAQLIEAEAEALRQADEYAIKSELAEELKEIDPEQSAVLAGEALQAKGMAAIEGERAREIREMLSKNDIGKMEERYENLGHTQVNKVDMVGFDLGSFGKIEALLED